MKGQMTAARLRTILLISMLLIVVGASAAFLFVRNNLNEYATTISRLNADANSGDQNIQTLRHLQTRLKDEQATIQSAHAIVADKSTYADQVINDIGRISAEAGVAIDSFEFVDDQAAAAAATAPGTAPATTTQPTLAGGVTKKSVTVSVENPIDYSKLLTFIKKIETNTLKMQIASVMLTKDKGNQVTTQTFSIEVYVRQ